MKKQQIKQKLLNFHNDFKKEQGGFKSLSVLYDYANFLQSEKFIKKLLAEKWNYAEEQKAIVTKGVAGWKIEDLALDPQNLCALPGFEKEMKIYQERIDKGIERFDVYDLVPTMILLLLIVSDVMSSIKNNEMAKPLKEVTDIDISTLTENAKNISMSFNSLKVLPDKKVTVDSSKFFEDVINVLNKYIIDQIDSEEFLEKGETEQKINFDKERSELNIFGEIVKIQLKSNKPNDHYILEYLFEQDDIFETADFRDIAENK